MKSLNILVNEHRIIEQVLNCLEWILDRCRANGRLERGPAEDAVTFFREFAEALHLPKAHSHLFPLVAETTCASGGRMAELTSERETYGHSYLEAMAEAIELAVAGDKGALKRFVEDGEAYIGLIMNYIENEEDWLFPHAGRILDDETKEKLAAEFRKMDTDRAHRYSRKQCVEIADRLAEILGVPKAVLLPT